MVCEPSKMPINLETNNKEHNTFTTSLITNYENSSCIVKNKGSHLQVLYDTFSKPQVSFTDDTGESQIYTLDDIKIYTPSLHMYDGKKTEGELILNHYGGKENLKICVPLVSSTNINNENKTLKEIFRHSCSKAQCHGESVSIHIDNFNAGSFIPKSSYYYYESTSIDGPCNCKISFARTLCGEKNKIIVYHSDDGYIQISPESAVLLSKMITSHKFNIKNNDYKYTNINGSVIEGMETHKTKDLLKKEADEKCVEVEEDKNAEAEWIETSANPDRLTSWISMGSLIKIDSAKSLEFYYLGGFMVGWVALLGMGMYKKRGG
tara:strand:+ start:808 stop:1770 length:963 start_codon:yes stop_codon:yes gene_type:complete